MEVDQLPRVQLREGRRGPWSIRHFTISPEDAFIHNIREGLRGSHRNVKPGTFTALVHDERGIVMSDTPAEASDHLQVMDWLDEGATTFLVHGLGLGMIATWLCSDPRTERVDVVELDADVIALTGPQLAHFDNLHIHHGSAYTHQFPPELRWDAAWHDIWDDISDGNLPDMAILEQRYAERTRVQGSWAKELCERMWDESAALLDQVYIQRGPGIGDEAAESVGIPSRRGKQLIALTKA